MHRLKDTSNEEQLNNFLERVVIFYQKKIHLQNILSIIVLSFISRFSTPYINERRQLTQ